MSCLTGALVLVPRSPKGGYWIYNGYSTSAAGPFNMTPANPVFPGYAPGQVLYGGESDFLIYVKDKTNGFYSLSYYFESGNNTLKIQVIDDSLCVAQDQTITMSSSGSPVDLTTYLDDLSCASHETGGDWEDLDSSGALTGSSFDPQTAGAGTWRIRYYFNESGFTDACCDTEIILTIVVTANFSIDILTTDTTCAHTLTVIDPVSSVALDVDVAMEQNYYPTISFKTKVTSPCSSDVVSAVKKYTPNNKLYTRINTDQEIFTGGFIETLTVYSVTTGTLDIPLAPSGSNQAVFSGSAGTTNATALTYNEFNPTVFANAIDIAIRNYLTGEGYVEGVDFKYGFSEVDSFGIPGIFSIYFEIFHNAPNNWIGIQLSSGEINYNLDGSTPDVSVNTSVAGDFDAILVTDYIATPCLTGPNKLTWVSNPFTVIDDTGCDYDVIDLTAAAFTITRASGNSVYSCDAKVLTATPFNCGGTVGYTWSSGESVAAITKLVGTGSYTINATCSSPASSDSDSIII